MFFYVMLFIYFKKKNIKYIVIFKVLIFKFKRLFKMLFSRFKWGKYGVEILVKNIFILIKIIIMK